MTGQAYSSYWRRKQLLAAGTPRFPLRHWWPSDGLCDIEATYFALINHRSSVLDFGAGDLRIMHKFRAAGYTGDYHTLDIGPEHEHTYRDASEVSRSYEAIMCLDVIEHMTLTEGLTLLDRLVDLLEPGGVLILQTPNARCIRNPLSWDMTHVHCYNGGDLWAFLRSKDMTVDVYRVVFDRPKSALYQWPRRMLSRYVTTRLLGADYADNLAVVARKADTIRTS